MVQHKFHEYGNYLALCILSSESVFKRNVTQHKNYAPYQVINFIKHFTQLLIIISPSN